LSVLGRGRLTPAVRLTQTARFSAVVQRHVSGPLLPVHSAPAQHTGLLSR